jgi:hypothetical protein
VNEDDEEDEEEQAKPRGRPNAWWAEHKGDIEETKEQATTYDAGYRAVPRSRRGGEQTVHPDDVVGSMGYCWCGLPYDHDWPGKHPRLETSMTTAETGQRIERRQLRAYHDDLVDVITEAVNVYGARYRLQRNGILLFPPDGTQGITIAARHSARQVRSARLWFLRHCVGVGEEGTAETEQAEAEQAQQEAEQAHQEELAEVHDIAPEQEPEAEWRPYVTTDGAEHPFFETNGTLYRCKECLGTEHEYVTDHIRGIGGHVRMFHRDTENLRSPEALHKSTESKRYNKLTARVERAAEILDTALGRVADGGRVTELEAANRALQQENEDLRRQIGDMEARLALAREAFGL